MSRNIYDRITIPLFFACFFSILLITEFLFLKNLPKTFFSHIFIVFSILLGFFSIQKLIKIYIYNNIQIGFQKKIRSNLSGIVGNRKNGSKILGFYGGPSTFWFFSDLSVFKCDNFYDDPNLKYIMSGWITNSPLQNKFLNKFGLSKDYAIKSAVDHPSIFFMQGTSEFTQMNYIKYHYPKVVIDTFFIDETSRFCAFTLRSKFYPNN
jgi:hypothetical protein